MRTKTTESTRDHRWADALAKATARRGPRPTWALRVAWPSSRTCPGSVATSTRTATSASDPLRAESRARPIANWDPVGCKRRREKWSRLQLPSVALRLVLPRGCGASRRQLRRARSGRAAVVAATARQTSASPRRKQACRAQPCRLPLVVQLGRLAGYAVGACFPRKPGAAARRSRVGRCSGSRWPVDDPRYEALPGSASNAAAMRPVNGPSLPLGNASRAVGAVTASVVPVSG